jgi:LPXTG-motif cell wall-anchored protein
VHPKLRKALRAPVLALVVAALAGGGAALPLATAATPPSQLGTSPPISLPSSRTAATGGTSSHGAKTPSTPSTASGQLPATGSEPLAVAVIGVALLAVGVGLRRRFSRHAG